MEKTAYIIVTDHKGVEHESLRTVHTGDLRWAKIHATTEAFGVWIADSVTMLFDDVIYTRKIGETEWTEV